LATLGRGGLQFANMGDQVPHVNLGPKNVINSEVEILKSASIPEKLIHEMGQAGKLTNFPDEPAGHQRDLMWYKAELKRASTELAMANTALGALAKNIEMMREDLLNKTALTISSQIMPLIGDIANDKLHEKSKVKLEVLAAYLRNMVGEVSSSQDAIPLLSSMEMQVAVLITKGFSSEKIARLLNRSSYTVRTHRRSIRKKVGILKSSTELSAVLKQLLTGHKRTCKSQP
jgi:DNA-binding CsgD family transcriptional regulator